MKATQKKEASLMTHTLDNSFNNNVKLNDTIVNHVYSTKDYSKFKLVHGNRKILKRKVRQLEKAIELDNKNLTYPVVVNNNFQIIDGQHRFIALAKNGKSICYIVDNTFKVKTIAKINTVQDKWKCKDYLNTYIMLGYDDYKVFNDFMKLHNTNFTVTLILFNGKFTGTLYHEFADGNFKATLEKVNRANKWIKRINDMREFIPKIYKDRHFVRAMMNCFQHPEYNHKRMINKMKINYHTITKSTNRIDYLRQLEETYNKYAKDNKIRFF